MSEAFPTISSLVDTLQSFRLDHRVAWVTGAGRGLGRAIALGLAAAGASVTVTARSENELAATAHEIEAMGGESLVAPGSVTSSAEMDCIVDHIIDRFGALDILVNNAGISPSITRSEDLPDEEWRHVINVNLTGAFFCARAAARKMLGRGGSIVNVSSAHGSVGMARMTAYAASKGGLELMTESLALEWADRGVRVNTVAPGYLETDMTEGLRAHDSWRTRLLDATPLGRFGRPEEVVPAVIYLASDASSYVTGATHRVDGGWTAE